MGGYFICNGIERIIRLLVQQRRHYIMALRRSAFRKRGSNYTDLGTLIRWTLVECCPPRSCVLHLWRLVCTHCNSVLFLVCIKALRHSLRKNEFKNTDHHTLIRERTPWFS